MKNGCNTQVVHILCKKRDGKYNFKGHIRSRLKNPVELSHQWVLKISNIRSQNFIPDYLISLKNLILKFFYLVWMFV